jgi:hypothetical protein
MSWQWEPAPPRIETVDAGVHRFRDLYDRAIDELSDEWDPDCEEDQVDLGGNELSGNRRHDRRGV